MVLVLPGAVKENARNSRWEEEKEKCRWSDVEVEEMLWLRWSDVEEEGSEMGIVRGLVTDERL